MTISGAVNHHSCPTNTGQLCLQGITFTSEQAQLKEMKSQQMYKIHLDLLTCKKDK